MIYSIINNVDLINESVLSESELEGYKIFIPRAYAREETQVKTRKPEEIEKIDHYELYISKQIGSVQTRRDTFVYVKLPKSENYIPIILHVDGGVSFQPITRRLAFREFDELDRRIILGYCRKFQSTLVWESHNGYGRSKFYLQQEAAYYRASHQPKRFKLGSEGNDFSRFYKDLKPYELAPVKMEQNVFGNLRLI